MVAASASASLARCVAHKTSASGSAKSAFAGKPVAPARAAASRARRAGVTTRAVVTPPQTHDNARPDTTLRPVSAAAVDSSKALEQFRSMGGASREFISRIFSASERARTGGRGRERADAIRVRRARGTPGTPRGVCAPSPRRTRGRARLPGCATVSPPRRSICQRHARVSTRRARIVFYAERDGASARPNATLASSFPLTRR